MNAGTKVSGIGTPPESAGHGGRRWPWEQQRQPVLPAKTEGTETEGCWQETDQVAFRMRAEIRDRTACEPARRPHSNLKSPLRTPDGPSFLFR